MVITTREASATTSAEPRGMTGDRTAIRASSRGPMPPGNGMSRNPTVQASAYPPAARNSMCTLFPAMSPTSKKACSP
jgi:hypothetical protein